jgi:hypothetical protein
MKTWRSDRITIGGFVLLGFSLIVSALWRSVGVPSFLAGLCLNAGTAFVLVGILVPVERRITQRLEATERAAQGVSAQVSEISEQVLRLAEAIDRQGPRTPGPQSEASSRQSWSESRTPTRPSRAQGPVRQPEGRPMVDPEVPPSEDADRPGVSIALMASVFLLAVGVTLGLTIFRTGHHKRSVKRTVSTQVSESAEPAVNDASYDPVLIRTGEPISAAFGPGVLWTGNLNHTLTGVDIASNALLTAPIKLPDNPAESETAPWTITVVNGTVWVPQEIEGAYNSGTISTFNAHTGRALGAPLHLSDSPAQLFADGGSILVSGFTIETKETEGGSESASSGDQLTRIDTRTRRLVGPPIELSNSDSCSAALVGPSTFWSAECEAGYISRYDANSGEQIGRRIPADEPLILGIYGGQLWVASRSPNAITRRNPLTGAPIGSPIPLPGPVESTIGLVHEQVWVLARPSVDGDAIVRIDAETGVPVGGSTPLHDVPLNTSIGSSYVWIPYGHGVLRVNETTGAPVGESKR